MTEIQLSNQQWKGLILSSSKAAKEEVAQLLVQCFKVLDTYGKPQEYMRDIVPIFIDTLGEYKIEDIRHAFREYLKIGRVMPKPADIVELLPKGNAPKDWTNPNAEPESGADFIKRCLNGNV